MQIVLPEKKTDHSGATLVEVLMSLLIFSVGIVSVFTLFPVALLSSIQATKLTNSKILVDNVSEIVRARPSLLLGGQPWLPNTNYAANDWVFPSPNSGTLRPVHLKGFQASGAATTQIFEPHWSFTGNVIERNSSGNPVATWAPNTPGWAVDTSTDPDTLKTYVIDPLGELSRAGSTFGTNIYGTKFGSALPRRGGDELGIDSTPQEIADYFVLQDSWNTAFEVIPVSISGSGLSITLPTGVTADGINLDQRLTRVVLSNIDRTSSQIRYLDSGTGGNTLVLKTAIGSSFNGPLRVETFNSRYSWLATVNRDTTGRVLAECVIFFNRSFNETDEQLYEYSINGDDSVTIEDWMSPNNRPLLREGNYCLDTRSGRWHTIVNISEGTNTADLTLSPSLQGSFSTGDQGDMIFMPGIVTVFEMEL